jgi:hypothetical protein
MGLIGPNRFHWHGFVGERLIPWNGLPIKSEADYLIHGKDMA